MKCTFGAAWLISLVALPSLCVGSCIPAPEKLPELRSCADLGDAGSQLELSIRYSAGLGVPRNYKTAFLLAQRAANQNLPSAQNIVGLSYYDGRGVKQDKVMAYMWWSISLSNLDYRQARERLNNLEAEMTSEQISRAQQMAAKWEDEQRKRSYQSK